MKWLIIALIICSIGIHHPSAAQTKNLNGVYAGIQLTLSAMMGGGMNRQDYVILFRPDGTLNDKMDKPDWRTAVTAHYQLVGQQLTITYPKGNKDKYTITSDGLLDGGGYTLSKLDGSTVPTGYYKFSSASSAGGMGTGMVYVGVAHDAGLNFDGKGHFSSSKSSATAIIGDNVGGGGSKKGGGYGTYKINNGQLTLTFSDGHVEEHTFFCRIQDKKPMAAIDGDLYFQDDGEDDKPVKSTAKTKSNTGNNATTTTDNSSNNAAADGKSLLLKANELHGGTKLDGVKTVKFSATIMGLKAVSFIDADAGKVRIELWKNGKLASIEQLEGDGGWQWQNGHKNALPANRVAEMKNSFYSGVMGLRKSVIDGMQIVNVKKMNNSITSVMCKCNGNEYIFAFNNQGQLVLEGSKAGTSSQASVSALTDLRPVQGVMIPFHEVLSSGAQKMVIQYDNFEINPMIGADAWLVPNAI
ncbi:hypothetical protein [Mucilaginibacter aquaedulcis]|uniref:hypothetical protein n=1 Tax=Mucilaginibacter aquaedulcis TaxID=1187081 RepID=UPI0025B5E998|nr:hypothetical protein [Mucilaginibacter aquaedulcis]MDN3548078.1 hypothetical protein [Mucilaginibacter aquaedulcis]